MTATQTRLFTKQLFLTERLRASNLQMTSGYQASAQQRIQRQVRLYNHHIYTETIKQTVN